MKTEIGIHRLDIVYIYIYMKFGGQSLIIFVDGNSLGLDD